MDNGILIKEELSEKEKEIKNKFLEAMDDDFNTALAISYLYELVKIINKTDDVNKLFLFPSIVV